MEFERAALLRDKIAELKGEKVASPQVKTQRGGRGKRGGGANRGSDAAGASDPTARPTNLPKRPPRPRPSGA
jgi:hypothetical protein